MIAGKKDSTYLIYIDQHRSHINPRVRTVFAHAWAHKLPARTSGIETWNTHT